MNILIYLQSKSLLKFFGNIAINIQKIRNEDSQSLATQRLIDLFLSGQKRIIYSVIK